MPNPTKGLGWLPDLPDHRDFLYAAPTAILKTPQTSVDLRNRCPKQIYDQGRIGSCTANAIAGAIEFDQIKQGKQEATPSRLFIYYNERKMEHTILTDSGAQIRDGIKSVAKLGACPESLWTYDDTPPQPEDAPCPNCKFAQKPTDNCYTEALKHKLLTYQRVPHVLGSMKGCLASGYPFVFGFTVYDNFPFQTTTGEVPMPTAQNAVLGGHAVLAVGYDDATQVFYFRNSWGAAWGRGGYGLIPYAYLVDSDLSDDFWTIRTID
jgi:C1A family cysteine protease